MGEEIGGLLVTGSLYNVPYRHNQSPPHLLLLNQMKEKKNRLMGDFLFQFLFFLEDSIFKSAGFFCEYCCSLSEIPSFLLNLSMSWVSAVVSAG